MATEALEQEDDEALALRVAVDKNRAAAEILVDRYSPKLFGYLTERFGATLHHAGVEDAMQEAFRRMLRYISSYDRKIARFEAWMIRLAHNAGLKIISGKDRYTYEAFTNEPVFFPPEPDDGEAVDGKKDWRVKALDDFVEKKLKGFEQAVARAFIATGGDIDVARLIQEWGKTRNHVDVAKSVVRKKFKEELMSVEKNRVLEKGNT